MKDKWSSPDKACKVGVEAQLLQWRSLGKNTDIQCLFGYINTVYNNFL